MSFNENSIVSIPCNRNNYGSIRSTSIIKYIVIHYTANNGDTAKANGNYFKNNPNISASAHYFVDDNYVVRSVADNYIAWSVGGSKYANCSSTGGGKYYGNCTNTNSISIELCDCNKDYQIYATQKTINRALELTEYLMKKYNIPKANVIRHFDVTGKLCPEYWCGTTAKNAKWKSEFWNKIGFACAPVKEFTTTNTNNTIDKIIKIAINTKIKEYKAKNVNGNNYVEARKFLETLGYKVGFNNTKKRVTVDDKLTLDIPTIIENGTSYIHIRECIDFLNKYDTFKFIQDKSIEYRAANDLIIIS